MKEVEAAEDLPKYIALVNPISTQAYAMRLDKPVQFTATKSIFTSKKEEHRFDWPIRVVDYSTEANVCDAAYMRAFRLRLGDGIPEGYTKRLWEALFSLEIDGEPMVKRRPLKELLGQKEILLPKPIPRKGCLFAAHTLKYEELEYNLLDKPEADPDKWIGYMLPNGTKIHASLDRVPAGGGLIKIEFSWTLGIYSTKRNPSAKLND